MTPALAEAQDRAHLLVTRLLHGERDAVAQEVASLDDMEVLRVALVLLDLQCWTFARFCDYLNIDSDEARSQLWGRLLVEVAAWREVSG